MYRLALLLLIVFANTLSAFSQTTEGTLSFEVNGKPVNARAISSTPFCLSRGDTLGVYFEPDSAHRGKSYVISSLGLFGQLNLTATTTLMMLPVTAESTRPGYRFVLKDHLPMEATPDDKIIRIMVRGYDVYEVEGKKILRRFKAAGSEFSFLMVKKC